MHEVDFRKKYSKVESEFMKIQNKINNNLNRAKKLIDEANDIAKKAGMKNLAQFPCYDNDFESGLENAGWNTSSMSC